MAISEKIKATGWPLEDVIVVGGGLLDQLGLRPAGDIDVVVSPELFATISSDSRYRLEQKGPDRCCIWDNNEVFSSWFGVEFDELKEQTVSYDGVKFLDVPHTIEWKRRMARSKDIDDIATLEAWRG